MTWETRATAFTWTIHEDRLLAVLHERLGVAAWEVPGGHLDDGETFEQAAARETLEETGIAVEVQGLLATCVHEWVERRQRRLIMFFTAVPVQVKEPLPGDPRISRAEWVDLGQLRAGSTSAFLYPLLELAAGGSDETAPPIVFRAGHRQDDLGCWRPYILPGVLHSNN